MAQFMFFQLVLFSLQLTKHIPVVPTYFFFLHRSSNLFNFFLLWITVMGDNVSMFTCTYLHKPLMKIMWPSVITRLTAHFTVACCLIWLFASTEKVFGHTWHRMSLLRPDIINTYTAKPVCWNGWISDSYCSLKPLCSGMGEVVPARTSPTLLPPSPRTVLSLSCFKVLQCINCRDWHCKS